MRRLIQGFILGAAVCFLATVARAQGPGSTALWQITILGNDQGVMFLTFSNNVSTTDTIDGYGISLEGLGPFSVNGTWGLDDKGNITGGYTRFFQDQTSEGNQLRAKIIGNGRFIGKTIAKNDSQILKAPPADAVPDLSGAWVAKGRQAGRKTLQTFALVASTNLPGWFDLSGSGIINNTGSIDLTGAVLITSDRHVGAYNVTDLGTATVQAAFSGRLSKNGKNLVLVGKDEDQNNIVIHAKKNIFK